MKKHIFKLLIALLGFSLSCSTFAQNGQKQFESSFNHFKNAKTLIIEGEFDGYGEKKGKVIKAKGQIFVVKNNLTILKYKAIAKSEMALLEKKYNEKVLFDGSNVYIYNQENTLLNKGAWEKSGKKYIGYSSILYNNIEITFRTFEKNKSNIFLKKTKSGYFLLLPNTTVRGEIQMHFKTGDLFPEKIIYYTNKNSKVDFVRLNLTKIESNISFDKNFFKLEKFIELDTDIQTSSDIISNSSLLPLNTIAPDWKLINQSGVSRKLSDYKGKIVVLDFWATWCAPCVQAQPKLQSIHEKYDDVVVLGMNFNDKKNIDLEAYRTKKKLDYEMILDTEKIADLYKVISLPTAYVIDKSGKIVYSSIGYSEEEERQLILVIQKALQ